MNKRTFVWLPCYLANATNSSDERPHAQKERFSPVPPLYTSTSIEGYEYVHSTSCYDSRDLPLRWFSKMTGLSVAHPKTFPRQTSHREFYDDQNHPYFLVGHHRFTEWVDNDRVPYVLNDTLNDACEVIDAMQDMPFAWIWIPEFIQPGGVVTWLVTLPQYRDRLLRINADLQKWKSFAPDFFALLNERPGTF